jgi:hypothetical protein
MFEPETTPNLAPEEHLKLNEAYANSGLSDHSLQTTLRL